MKVFVHLNHGRDEAYLLEFAENMTVAELKGILETSYDKASLLLMTKSRKKIPILPKDRRRAQNVADFTLTENYTTERLA